MNTMQIYTISQGLGRPTQNTEGDDDDNKLMPTSVLDSLRPIGPDEAHDILYPAGVGPSGTKPEKRERLPLMDR